MNKRKIRGVNMGWGGRGESPSPPPQVSNYSLTRHLRRAYALLTQKKLSKRRSQNFVNKNKNMFNQYIIKKSKENNKNIKITKTFKGNQEELNT